MTIYTDLSASNFLLSVAQGTGEVHMGVLGENRARRRRTENRLLALIRPQAPVMYEYLALFGYQDNRKRPARNF